MKLFRIQESLLVLYLLIATCCFGPATVQTDQDFEDCRNDRHRFDCMQMMPSGFHGLVKAAAWPLWISYIIARRAELKS